MFSSLLELSKHYLKYTAQTQLIRILNSIEIQSFKGCDSQLYNSIIKMSFQSQLAELLQEPAQENKRLQSRDYKCPCGKTYLSYAALFTHIKQKHQGKAPGQIVKPMLPKKPRGRPPLSAKNKFIAQENEEQIKQSLNSMKTQAEYEDKNLIYWELYSDIFNILKEILYPQVIDRKIWEKVSSFAQFEEFIDKNLAQNKTEMKQVSIGYGLSQFLKEVSLREQPFRFQQVLILFMLLLEYAIDQSNYPKLVQEAPVQFLIQFMNPFINQYVTDICEYLDIETIWVTQKNNMQKIFECFYNWLKWKEYTSFCITLID